MIVDIKQKQTSVQVSYTDERGGISLCDIPLPEQGYQNWVICDADDPDRSHDKVNWDGKPVKKVSGKRFEDLNLHEFIQIGAPVEYRELLHKTNIPHAFSVDIETEITDDAMPDAETAPNKILSISVTAPNMATVLLSLKQCDMEKTMSIVNEEMKAWSHKYTFRTKHIVFNTEKEMLEYFCIKCRDIFHVIIGWNYLSYDNQYIKNRCKKCGINYNICSPTQELDGNGTPLHRLVIDYLEVYKERASRDITSFKLDNVAEYEIGMHKLKYEKTLRELYREDYDRFCAYAIIDTILVQLIHKKKNSISLQYNMAYYCKIPIKHAGKQISQTDALIFKEFWNTGRVWATPRTSPKKYDYPGAFVKPPTQHEVDFPSCWDAKSLYPSSGITMKISPDSYLGKVKNDMDIPRLRKEGYIVTHRKSIYKTDKQYLFPKLWKDLRVERDVYKAAMFRIWQNIEEKVENEAKRRGFKLRE